MWQRAKGKGYGAYRYVAKSRMESVEEVQERIREVLEHIDEERLIAAPDCGLGFFDRNQAKQKMQILSKAVKNL